MDSADAISEFIEKGGRIVTLQGTIPVTAPEVLEYLLARGIRVDYSPAHPRRYLCKGKSVTLNTLLAVANTFRRRQQLPPFVARTKV